jgi:putative redox protein
MNVLARSAKNYQVEITAGNHQWISDEPREVGDDKGPNPYALLLSALGACKVITTQMYARKKGWPLDGVVLDLHTYKIHAKDCEDCESDPNAKIDVIEVEISFQGELTTDQIKRLAEISEHCPVHRTLTSETKIRTTLVEPDSALQESGNPG